MRRGIIYGALLGVVLLGVWGFMRRRDTRRDNSVLTPALGLDDRAKLVLDNAHHTITRVERNTDGSEKVTKSFLNSHGPVAVVEKKDGSTVLIQRTWGTEFSPFAGGAMGSDLTLHASLGLDVFYVQRWELGGGLLLNKNTNDIRAFAHVSYNVYGNAFVSVGIDNRKTVQLIAGLKF